MLTPCNSQDNPSVQVDSGRNVDRAIHQNCSIMSCDTTGSHCDSHSLDDEELELEGDQNDLVVLDMLEAYSQVVEISQILFSII